MTNNEATRMTKTTYNFLEMSKADALRILVDLDVSTWGEGERAPSTRMQSWKSIGLLINTICHHCANDFGDSIDAQSLADAKSLLSPADWVYLRSDSCLAR